MSRVLGRSVVWTARALAVLLAGGGLYLLGADISRSLSDRALDFKALGAVWYEIGRGTLNAFQAGVQRHVSADLWDHVISPVLLWPAWVLPLALAVLLAALTWPRRRKG